MILHRKNALFYKTLNGAHVGDIFMSLIYTAELNGAAPFDYLVVLQTPPRRCRRASRGLDALELPRYPRSSDLRAGCGSWESIYLIELIWPIGPDETIFVPYSTYSW